VRISRVAVAERLEDVGQPAVEVLQAAMEVDGSLRCPQSWSVSTRFVKTSPESTFSSSSIVRLMPSTFDFVGTTRRCRSRRRCRDLPDAVRRVARVADRREVVRAPRLEREVVPVRRALVVAGRSGRTVAAITRPTACLPVQDLARDPAAGW
jgi:hypothetical protein